MSDQVGRCTSAQTPWLRESVGAYAMDALDPEESDAVADHLAQCADCRSEYLEFRELLPLMGAISEGEARNGPVRPAVPEAWVRPEVPAAVASAAVAEVEAGRVLVPGSGDDDAVDVDDDDADDDADGRHDPGSGHESGSGTEAAPEHSGRRSRRTSRVRPIRVVVAAMVLAVGCMMGAGMGQAVPGASAAWSASAGPAAPKADPDAMVDASVLVAAAPWGAAIHMVIEHVPDGYECTMIVVAADGRRDAAATWRAPNRGTFTVPAATSITPDQISAIEVRLPDGTLLISFRHP